ncbi:MAG: 3-phosphoshikimate 1-carboxyvinyltransferase [Bacillota bacterium]|nr:3-phosphoshikimate 1-carboxyvinyltransferase [Bacillota bacterium]MDW7677331.1 3-phosphoshikimate 1-carboxyvinyltransferase [Bacillota bacterium]
MLTMNRAFKLIGTCRVPGDKSISHRAVMLAGISRGVTHIKGFLNGEDCLSTLRCFQQMGVKVETDAEIMRITGSGLYGLKEPGDVLDAGNSGTTMRLMAGILSGQPFMSVVTGDGSLKNRPMDRIAVPLRLMGARIDGREEGRKAPLVIRGGSLKAIHYEMPVASAQVKSAVLLAGLYAEGSTSVTEIRPSRDHTERMLEAFGVNVGMDGLTRTIHPSELTSADVEVPGDISSAAFLLAAAACLPGSDITLKSVGLNPTRAGIITVLSQMGADITTVNERHTSGEPIGDIIIRGGALTGIEIGEEMIPSLIDEIPVIAVAAACAKGTTRITGARELRVKETDRISAMAQELNNVGVQVETLEDGMVIHGPQIIKGGQVNSHGDHRIAMAMAVAGLLAKSPVHIRNHECIAVSFPGFEETLQKLVVV